jgi:hypothetical protein
MTSPSLINLISADTRPSSVLPTIPSVLPPGRLALSKGPSSALEQLVLGLRKGLTHQNLFKSSDTAFQIVIALLAQLFDALHEGTRELLMSRFWVSSNVHTFSIPELSMTHMLTAQTLKISLLEPLNRSILRIRFGLGDSICFGTDERNVLG